MIPECPTHHVLCHRKAVFYGSNKLVFAGFACPVAGCKFARPIKSGKRNYKTDRTARARDASVPANGGLLAGTTRPGTQRKPDLPSPPRSGNRTQALSRREKRDGKLVMPKKQTEPCQCRVSCQKRNQGRVPWEVQDGVIRPRHVPEQEPCGAPGRLVRVEGTVALEIVACAEHRRRLGRYFRITVLPKAGSESALAPGHVLTDHGIEIGGLGYVDSMGHVDRSTGAPRGVDGSDEALRAGNHGEPDAGTARTPDPVGRTNPKG